MLTRSFHEKTAYEYNDECNHVFKFGNERGGGNAWYELNVSS
jgi:hypothetical protein